MTSPLTASPAGCRSGEGGVERIRAEEAGEWLTWVTPPHTQWDSVGGGPHHIQTSLVVTRDGAPSWSEGVQGGPGLCLPS